MIELILILGLPVVMLAQGVALSPGDLRLAKGSGRSIVASLALRLIAMPLVALICGWIFGLGEPLSTGLILVALAVPTVAALPLAGVSGATLPMLSSMIAIGTVAGLIWWPIVGGALIDHAGAGWIWRDMLLLAALPFGLGLYLRSRGVTGGRLLPVAASVVIGIMNLGALIRGWDAGVLSALQACVVLAIAAIFLGLLVGRSLYLRPDVPTTLAYGVLMSAVALPIGLTARLDPALGLPAAVYGIVIYVAATGLIALRMRKRA